MNQNRWNWMGSFAAGFLGACLAMAGFLRPHNAQAFGGSPPIQTTNVTSMTGSSGAAFGEPSIAAMDGGSALYFFDGQDRSRLEVGTYPDGLPLVVLEGENHTPKAILRMAGANQVRRALPSSKTSGTATG